MKNEHDNMKAGDHEQMMQEEHRKNLWAHLTNVVLGAWLITSPFTCSRTSFETGHENARAKPGARGGRLRGDHNAARVCVA